MLQESAEGDYLRETVPPDQQRGRTA